MRSKFKAPDDLITPPFCVPDRDRIQTEGQKSLSLSSNVDSSTLGTRTLSWKRTAHHLIRLHTCRSPRHPNSNPSRFSGIYNMCHSGSCDTIIERPFHPNLLLSKLLPIDQPRPSVEYKSVRSQIGDYRRTRFKTAPPEPTSSSPSTVRSIAALSPTRAAAALPEAKTSPALRFTPAVWAGCGGTPLFGLVTPAGMTNSPPPL